MHKRWFHARLRTAERALATGAIDDAYEAVVAGDLVEQKRAAELLSELAATLLARARVHTQAGRFDRALAELDRVAVLKCHKSAAAELRERVLRERSADAEADRREQTAEARAAERLAHGRYDTGRAAAADLPEQRRAAWHAAFDQQQSRDKKMQAQLQAALQRDDILGAARVWRAAHDERPEAVVVEETAGELAPHAAAYLLTLLRDGKLEAFLAAYQQMRPLREHRTAAFEELERAATLVERAMRHTPRIDLTALRQTLLRLKGLVGAATWLDDALRATAETQAATEQLLASPLGLAASQAAGRSAETPTPPVQPPPIPTAAPPLLLLVDGGGSSLLVRASAATLGRSRNVDVLLPGRTVQAHHADLVRRGDDVFLMPRAPVTLNGRGSEGALLRDGDRLAVGEYRFTFRQPSARSATYVIEAAATRRLPHDVSRVLLVSDVCLIGGSSTHHVRTDEAAEAVMLYERDGEWWARPERGGAAMRVELGKPNRMGEIGFTLIAHPDGAPPGRV